MSSVASTCVLESASCALKWSCRLGSSALSIALLASPVAAQTSETPGAKTAQSSEQAMGDIIVTAQKRAQSINNVGLTITAVGGEALRSRQISSLDDIAKIVPGLSYANTQSGTPVYTLRGVGFYDTSLGAYPTVSVYLD